MATDYEVQKALALAGYPVTMDGVKGPKTNSAIVEALTKGIVDTSKPGSYIIVVRRGAIVTSDFGPRYLEGYGYHHHDGLDFGEVHGDPVEAAAEGRVVHSGDIGDGYGLSVVIEHPWGEYTRYGHMSRLDVLKEQWISRGHVIGAVGNTGRSSGAHLHFEVRKGHVWGTPLNPWGRVVMVEHG